MKSSPAPARTDGPAGPRHGVDVEDVDTIVQAPPSPRPRVARRVLTIAAYVVAGASLARLLLTSDLGAVGAMLAAAGPLAVLAIVPIAVQVGLEAGSWRLILARLGRTISFNASYRINLRTDAVRLSFPAGSPLADAWRPVLFARERTVTMSDAGAALVVRKLAHVASQGVFLIAGGVLGSSLFVRLADRLGPLARVAPLLCWIAGGALTAAAVVLALTFSTGTVAARVERFVVRATRGRAAAFFAKRRSAYASLDATLAAIWKERRCLVWNGLTGLGAYALDAMETFVMLWLLGVHVSVGDAIALEGIISVIRSVAFAVPGAIGVQDLSYHALLLGTVGDAGAMSLVLMKRARDVAWVVIGWLGPIVARRAARAFASQVTVAPVDGAVAPS